MTKYPYNSLDDYDCSVFGTAVTLAQRCCQIKDAKCSIVLPTSNWAGRTLEQTLTKRTLTPPDGKGFELEVSWRVFPPRKAKVKHQEFEITELMHDIGDNVVTGGFQIPLDGGPVLTGELATAQGRAKLAFEDLKKAGDYKPKRYPFEPIPEFFTKQSKL